MTFAFHYILEPLLESVFALLFGFFPILGLIVNLALGVLYLHGNHVLRPVRNMVLSVTHFVLFAASVRFEFLIFFGAFDYRVPEEVKRFNAAFPLLLVTVTALMILRSLVASSWIVPAARRWLLCSFLAMLPAALLSGCYYFLRYTSSR